MPAMDVQSLASPRLYPLSFDAPRERVRLVALDEAGYRAASFLDERLLESVGFGEWALLDNLRQAIGPTCAECDFIFHLGHVGSTLLSRLLGEHERVFSVREPAILRTLAVADLSASDPAGLSETAHLFLKLWARVWRPQQRTLLKATSFVSEIAPLLMGLSPSARAVLMVSRPRVHLAAILAGDASRMELGVNASMRLARLHRRLGAQPWRLENMSDGEKAAMSWACEAAALTSLAARFPDRVLWLEFDAFLADPEPGLAAVLDRLHGAAPEDTLEALLGSGHLGRYAKAPNHAFNADARRAILAQATAEHGQEIDRGMSWLEAAAAAHAPIETAVRTLSGLAQ